MLCGWEGRTALSRYRPCAQGARAPHGPRRAPVLQCTAHWPGTTSRVSTSERKSVPINVPIYINTLGSLPNCPVLGALCQMQSIHSSPRRTPTALAAVPGGWIDLTREGFCYAENFGILSFSVVAQSLVNSTHGW